MDTNRARHNPYEGLPQEQLNEHLLYFCENGDYDQVELLIQNGADVNAACGFGNTALMNVILHDDGDIDIINLLIQNNANIHVVNKEGTNALMHAARAGFSSVVALLIKNKADVNAVDLNGETALIAAAGSLKGNVETINLLIQHNARLEAIDNSGWNALKYATNFNQFVNDELCMIWDERAYRLLCELSYEQRKEFACKGEDYKRIVIQFEKELINNSNKVFNLAIQFYIGLYPSLSKESCGDVSSIIIRKLFIMQHSKDFPAWYKSCVETHFNLAWDCLKKDHSKNPEPMILTPSLSLGGRFFSGLTYCFNQVKNCLPCFISDKMQIDEPEKNNNNVHQEMEIDEISEPKSKGTKRKNATDDHTDGSAKKKLKTS